MRLFSPSNKLARGTLLAFAVSLIAATPAQAPPPKLPPIDQCADDRGLEYFRYTLGRAVARRDREALLALFAPDVLVNFGGSRGRDELVKEWEFDAAEYTNIWDQLETMLKLGCARSGEARVIPSLIMQLEPYANDDSERVLILPGAMLYGSIGVEAPNPTTDPWTLAPVISRLADWGIGVRLADGREGYIPNEDHYEPTDYRMLIEKRGDQWLITAFVAGD